MDPVNVTWPQGADLTFSLVYKVGPVNSATPVNISTWTLRMDIVSSATGSLIYTFNTNDNDVATVDEAVLGTAGEINITVPRSLTLPPSGAIYTQMQLATPVTTFNYDIFLRNPAGKQSKILKGMITVEPSVTLWL